jgi:hypothetical protein
MGGLDSVQEVESRELVAQLVEQRPFKAWVLGSNPSGLTTKNKSLTLTDERL